MLISLFQAKNDKKRSSGHAASPETIVIKRKTVTKTPKKTPAKKTAKTPRFVAKVGKKVTAASKTQKSSRKNINQESKPIATSNRFKALQTPAKSATKTHKSEKNYVLAFLRYFKSP